MKIIEEENRKAYPSDLTDAQWEVIKSLYSNMRVYKWSKRELTNALLYIVMIFLRFKLFTVFIEG